MIRCAWFSRARPRARVFCREPAAVPKPVAEYRARLEKPGGLAAEVLMISRDRQLSGNQLETAREDLAFAAMRTLEEVNRRLKWRRIPPAPVRKSPGPSIARATARRFRGAPREAAALAELAGLRMAAGEYKEALAPTAASSRRSLRLRRRRSGSRRR
jgi:hypothetical protein